MERLTAFLLANRIAVLALAVAVSGIGFWAFESIPVDALPDVSENQVIVSVDWPGVSPDDVEDQITYPLTSALQGLPSVKQVRSVSAFGFARIYVVFQEGTPVYWARERVSERLAQEVPLLPQGAVAAMGPDATPLGQIYWYTVQGPLDQGELRAIQDYTIKPALQSIPGVSEVSGIGGFQREYLVEADPELLRYYGVGLETIHHALAMSNTDAGAGTIERAGLEFAVRGSGRIDSVEDIENTYVTSFDGRTVTVGDLAYVSLGPGFRRGALADGSGELVGGIVVMRYGADPVEVIEGVEERLERLAPGLPDGVEIAAYYDRRQLIEETVGTLTGAITWQMIITALVVLAFLFHLKTSLTVASTLPFAVLLTFIGMKVFGVNANIMSFAGIAIAIGTIVDMGIVVSESIHQESGGKPISLVIPRAVSRVAPAIATSLSTTVISFVPVFFLQGQSGRLFIPLAWTKTLVLLAAGLTAVILVPVLSMFALKQPLLQKNSRKILVPAFGLGLLGAWASASAGAWLPPLKPWFLASVSGTAVFLIAYISARESLESKLRDRLEERLTASYLRILDWAFHNRRKMLLAFMAVILLSLLASAGAKSVFDPLEGLGLDPSRVRPVAALQRIFPGIGTQFMPPLDEGSFLFMPSLLSQASLNETVEVMIRQNRAMEQIPEVAQVVGKAGRADSPLDPAPVGMIETVITLNPADTWREGVSSDSILALLRTAVRMPGIAPSWLQPIETRIVMLQSGIVTNIGLEIRGDDPDELERIAVAAEAVLSEVSGAANVQALRTTRRPYLHVAVDRTAAADHGLSVNNVLSALSGAVSGTVATQVLNGREMIPVRVRYSRETRDETTEIGDIYVRSGNGSQVHLSTLATIQEIDGPAVIRSVDGELTGYVMLNSLGRDEGGLVREADDLLNSIIQQDRLLPPGERRLDLPDGYRFEWVGNYRNQEEARKRFALLIPLCLAAIFFLMYLQFRTLSVPLIIFLGTVPLAVAGGLLFIWAWPWLHNLLWSIGLTGASPEGPVYVTVAVVVGFIALMGICVDDGVLMATYMTQLKEERKPSSREEVRALTREAAGKRIRPALMTTVTTLAALVPVLLASGRGSDLARPMALPVFGGMLIELLTIMIVPVAYSWWMETRLPSTAGKVDDDEQE